MDVTCGRQYEFGPFRLEPDQHLLLRSGQAVKLSPKALELLFLLVRNPGQLLMKDQIMEALWPGSFVEEANIPVLISSLRKALGESEDEPYIQTVPKKGYRFTGAVSVAEPAELPVSASPAMYAFSRMRAARPALALLIPVLATAAYFTYRDWPAQHTLAVLPLRNLRHDPDSDFLGFSLADAIITKIGALNSITVRPSSAVEKYKGREIDVPEVAAQLKVESLLTGNFIHDGDRLHITYQLIGARANKILAKGVIDVKYDELIAVHDSVSLQVIKGLKLGLSPSETVRLKLDEPLSPLAYEFYLRGVDLMASHNFPLAVSMLEKSAGIDPNYALTWAYLGQSYTSDATFELGGRERYRRAQAAYERALAINPKQSEAETFYSNLLVDTGQVDKAVPLLRDAVARNANDAAVHWELGYAYRFAGMLAESLEECERARRIDPLVNKSNGSVLNTYLYLGRYDDFLHSLPDDAGSGFIRFYRGYGEYYQGKRELAAADLDRAYQEDRTLYTGIGKAFADAIAGRNAEGVELLREFQAKIQQRGVGDPEATYKMAQAYAALGDKASALHMFRASIEAGFFASSYFLRDPLLNTIRGLPEFPHLLEIARQRHESFRREFF
jgi:DNA-binding winged helix-turn-helix (wHTH) protein/TolB-like protein/tetratricopeptide (TPR) repeat protein